jgi:pimeloyl-ACP methyl ester carboxylesterase
MSFTSSSPPRAGSETIRERFITIQGCKMRYLTGGAGPAIVLLHGLMGYSFCWRLNLESLARHRRVFALDLPGTGFSSRAPALAGDISSLAEYTLAFLEAIEIDSATLMGSSHGGGLALVAASLAAERNISVPAMVLVAPVNPWSSQGRFLTRLGGSSAGARIVRSLARSAAPLHGTIVKRLYADPRRVTPETVEGYSRAINVPGSIDALLGRIKNWKSDMAKIEQALPHVSEIPTLLIWGEKDGAVYLSSAAELMKRLHHAELRVIAHASHLPFEEQPDEFNSLVTGFLERLHRQKYEVRKE